MKSSRISAAGFIRSRIFLKKMMPGIKLKSSFLIGFFVSMILAAATYMNYVNQSIILQENFDNETENSLNYINPIVNSIDSIRANLLLIEDMKIRISEKEEHLKKYRTFALRRKESVTNSFRNIGRLFGMKVRYDYYYKGYDNYYSTYLSKKDINLLEEKTADQLEQIGGTEISGSELKEIQSKANRVMLIRSRMNRLQDSIDENSRQIESFAEKDKKGTDRLNNQNRILEKKLAAEKKRIAAAEKAFRNRLTRYFNYQLKRIEDTGIYNSNIRIITYNPEGIPNSDTGSYFRDSLVKFAPLFDNKKFENDRSGLFSTVDIYSAVQPHEYDYITDKQYFHVKYVPVFKNPATSERLTAAIRELDLNSGRWRNYLKEDYRISAEIKTAAANLKARLDTLRESKNVPGKDNEFAGLYSKYKKLLSEREAAFKKYAPYSDEMNQISVYYKTKIESFENSIKDEKNKIEQLKTEKESDPEEFEEDMESCQSAINDYVDEIKKLKRDMEDAREDIWKSEKLSARNAIQYIREAALYDYAILNPEPDPSAYRTYLRSSSNREIESKRWSTLREWIISAKSETGLPENISGKKNMPLTNEGVLAYSRSETEEYMWLLDSTPIAGEIGLIDISLKGGITGSLLAENITGFHGVFIDKTQGITNIASNRDRMILYSVITALIAIILTYFLAGFMVKRIKNIIAGVQQAGRGNLNVEFPVEGLDEIEDLAVSLNAMVRGLKEREELKGEIAAAGEIQKTLLPEKIPSNLEGFYSIGTFYRSMQGVGGDYYDFIELDSESIFFCIADVSSHGVGPAIIMSMLRAHIHGILRRGVRELSALLMELNRQIFTETPPNIFVTIFTGIINRNSNEIEYCSAGHLRPVLYRYKDDTIEILNAGGLPVGMDDNEIFSETIKVERVRMKPGDLFFQYTDGITEAMDNSRILFGEERLYEEIKEYSRKKPDIMITKIAEAVESFTGRKIIDSLLSELNDDIAMIALKRLK